MKQINGYPDKAAAVHPKQLSAQGQNTHPGQPDNHKTAHLKQPITIGDWYLVAFLDESAYR